MLSLESLGSLTIPAAIMRKTRPDDTQIPIFVEAMDIPGRDQQNHPFGHRNTADRVDSPDQPQPGPQMAITDWPLAERPRERLLAQGAARLSDVELLSIFLRTGYAGKSATDLARDLLRCHGSLCGMLNSTPGQLLRSKGMGQAKTAQLLAAVELARRSLAEELTQRDALNSPKSVSDYLRLTLSGREHEVFVALLLDAQHRIIGCEELFRGTLTQTSVYPREVVKCALARNAAAVILAHNHPSGIAEPSQADEFLTRSLKAALALVDIRVLDHFIIGSGCSVSFAERGMI